MNDHDVVLTLNEAFYRAFAGQNFAAMDALWADGLPVSCVHPGWPPLVGRDAVMRGWRELLAQPVPTNIRAREEQVHVYGDAALVLCEEVLNGTSVLAATNLFAREDGVWRMVHHQAGPVAAAPPRETQPDPVAPPKQRLH